MTIEEYAIEQSGLESKFHNPIEELNKLIGAYGLTPNQSKVYLYLSKIGTKTASEISKNLKIPRTETYHLLNSLEQKGVVYSIFGKPTKFESVDIEKAIDILIRNEKNRVSEMESKKEHIVKLWKTIPNHGKTDSEAEENKFQSLQGKNSILARLQKMIQDSNEEVLVLGTEEDFMKFYHTEFTEYLKKCKGDLKVLTTYTNKGNYIFDDVPLEKIKKIEDKNRENFCFIIKDDDEVIFFINNSIIDNVMAIWTDSKSFVSTLKSLFKLVWKKSNHIKESDASKILGSEITYEHRLREIEQEKRILSYLQKNFKMNKKGVTKK
ncbi:TrmB family transcriptional regulator [Nitrosopumilus sp. K4]|uniref:TrmB family transcriptional regulator n=1 Tax=Nitrosopumilus sp. K4 TaxID=2795383 RepID=UPI001BAB947F|nr:TrmB family transcriptional regulator [Nitrosopumilus sp. K4]QUC65464.1 TrmB family transcriptional regulator [Nitrosopumilus sp. K4]